MHHDYLDSGFKVFGLYGMDAAGHCECGNPECEALYKHPRVANWQYTPDWSEDQLEVMEKSGQFNTGFGVLCEGFLIIDIDPRNGGEEGYKQLVRDTQIDYEVESGFVVRTGGNGLHIYFKNTAARALSGKLKEYKGVDFKSSGYVVGAGSMHASGSTYEIDSGYPDEVTDAPLALVELLQKKEVYKTTYDGISTDVSTNELREIITNIPPTSDYEEFIQIGMAIHEVTHGDSDGFEIWDEWCSKSDKYNPNQMVQKWHSFGKGSNTVGLGTLIMIAQENGYKQSVTFDSDLTYEPGYEFGDHPVPIGDIDLLRPQPDGEGMVGVIASWINEQCRYPREYLAVGAALSAVGNIGGLRHYDADYGVTANNFIFCVAASSTGKESVQQAQAELHAAAGIGLATYGAIKSEQELIRNLIKHQCSNYLIDEFGLVLQKIENARAKGSTAYLEGIIGTLMSVYSKADSRLLLSGDIVSEMMEGLKKEISALKKMASENVNTENNSSKSKKLEILLDEIKSGGLVRPFLSLMGYTTPVTFNSLIGYESATNGFMGRAIILTEKETNPRAKRGFKKSCLPDAMKMKLMQLATGGEIFGERLEYKGELCAVTTCAKADDALLKIQDWFEEYAEEHKDKTGLEPIVRRGFEQVLKISMVLGMARQTKQRTEHDVRWSYALVRKNIDEKISIVSANVAEENKDKATAIVAKIATMLDKDIAQTEGAIINRYRKEGKTAVQQALKWMEENNYARFESEEHKFNKTLIKKWYTL